MKTTILCLLSAILASGITGLTINYHTLSHSAAIHEREYNQALRKAFEFSDGFTFQLEDVQIKTFSDGKPSTRIIGRGNRSDVPITVDLIDETGESILASGASHASFEGQDSYLFFTHISLWTNSPELKLVATIFPRDDIKRQVVTQTIPNPIHFHRLLDLWVGSEEMRSLRSVGSRSSALSAR